jgi:hypothetical protein
MPVCLKPALAVNLEAKGTSSETERLLTFPHFWIDARSTFPGLKTRV